MGLCSWCTEDHNPWIICKDQPQPPNPDGDDEEETE